MLREAFMIIVVEDYKQVPEKNAVTAGMVLHCTYILCMAQINLPSQNV